MNIFVKPKILNNANTPCRLTKINVSDKDNHRLLKLVVLPTATEVSREIIVEFKKDCMKVVTHVVENI